MPYQLEIKTFPVTTELFATITACNEEGKCASCDVKTGGQTNSRYGKRNYLYVLNVIIDDQSMAEDFIRGVINYLKDTYSFYAGIALVTEDIPAWLDEIYSNLYGECLPDKLLYVFTPPKSPSRLMARLGKFLTVFKTTRVA